MSLIERKKRQWAEERAEMENFCTPWGLPPPAYRLEYSQSRSRYGSTLEIRNTCPAITQQDLLPRRQRSPSLPPILRYNDETSCDNNDTEPIPKLAAAGKPNKYGYEDGEGETSGYASESAPQSSPELWQNKQRDLKKGSQNNNHNDSQYHLPVPAWQYNERNSDESRRNQGAVNPKEESEQRLRWGDRGMAAGRLWEPQPPDARLPQMQAKGTPAWVERSLTTIDNGDTQILLLDQQSNHSSVGDGDYRSDHNSERNTFLLGQNVPIDASLKAERESRRIKAMELQTGIMQQLEERERQRKEEKSRRIREEREEEDRYRRQRELEKQRLDEEKMISEEKRKREQKRAEALRQALERAEQLAKLEKENKKNKKMQDNFDAMTINSEIIINHDTKDTEKSPQKHLSPNTPAGNSDTKITQNIYIEQAHSPRHNLSPEKNSKAYRPNVGSNENNMLICHPNSARFNCQADNYGIASQDEQKVDLQRQNPDLNNTFLQAGPPINLMTDAPVSLVQVPMPHELYTPVHFAHSNGVQMAILMPQHINSLYSCMHQPMGVHSSIFGNDGPAHHPKTIYQSHSQTDEESGSTRESRVLTPSKYRNPNSVDVSTQTDLEFVQINNTIVEPLMDNDRMRNSTNTITIKDQSNSNNTSEEILNSLTGKKDKRYASEERFTKDLESRPKWGVNKPHMQYKKQSEKDIFYAQKRKLRQRKRIQEKQYTSHSSDDNRSPSPPHELVNQFSTNTLDRNRISLSENHWRKKNQNPQRIFNSGSVMLETTQISPLECDKSGVVHIRNNINYQNQKKIYEKKATSGRGMTLSQKFMIDKYGNSKLWPSECPDNTVLSDIGNNYKKYDDNNTHSKDKEKYDNRKHYYDSLNKAKKEQSAYYCDPESNQPIVLDQLRSLRNSLKKQQQIWGKYDKSKRSPSPKNEVDLEID